MCWEHEIGLNSWSANIISKFIARWSANVISTLFALKSWPGNWAKLCHKMENFIGARDNADQLS